MRYYSSGYPAAVSVYKRTSFIPSTTDAFRMRWLMKASDSKHLIWLLEKGTFSFQTHVREVSVKSGLDSSCPVPFVPIAWHGRRPSAPSLASPWSHCADFCISAPPNQTNALAFVFTRIRPVRRARPRRCPRQSPWRDENWRVKCITGRENVALVCDRQAAIIIIWGARVRLWTHTIEANA